MILHYFKKKENKEKNVAIKQYEIILKESNYFLNKNNFFNAKDYNVSFEIVSIFIIMNINKNLLNKNKPKYLKINEYLISLFIKDLDKSLREKGIGDMSIGKYVKSYVKKFYFRIKEFPKYNENIRSDIFENYIKLLDISQNNQISEFSTKLSNKYKELIKIKNI